MASTKKQNFAVKLLETVKSKLTTNSVQIVVFGIMAILIMQFINFQASNKAAKTNMSAARATLQLSQQMDSLNVSLEKATMVIKESSSSTKAVNEKLESLDRQTQNLQRAVSGMKTRVEVTLVESKDRK